MRFILSAPTLIDIVPLAGTQIAVSVAAIPWPMVSFHSAVHVGKPTWFRDRDCHLEATWHVASSPVGASVAFAMPELLELELLELLELELLLLLDLEVAAAGYPDLVWAE